MHMGRAFCTKGKVSWVLFILTILLTGITSDGQHTISVAPILPGNGKNITITCTIPNFIGSAVWRTYSSVTATRSTCLQSNNACFPSSIARYIFGITATSIFVNILNYDSNSDAISWICVYNGAEINYTFPIPVTSVQLTDQSNKSLFSPIAVAEGNIAIIRCNTSPNGSRPRAMFRWYKRDRNQLVTLIENQSISSTPDPETVPGQTQMDLVISYSTLMLMGNRSFQNMYIFCGAQNEVNSGHEIQSTAIQLMMLYGPHNVQVTGDPVVNEGGRLTITCSGDCNPQCDSYRWWKGSQPTLIESSPSLLIDNTRRDHAGIYTCTVNNSAISNSSAAQITVTVNYGPDIGGVSLSPSNTSYQLTEFSHFTAQCSATCVPQCNYQWMGPRINQNDNMGLLSISQISRNQAGNFTCTVTNSRIPGKSAAASLSVIVYYGPDITVLTPSIMAYTLNESNSLPNINCLSDCFPNCTCRWYKGHTEIREYPEGTLSLGEVYRDEAGTYTCQSENAKSKNITQKEVQLVVQYPPTVSIKSRNGSFSEKGIMINCSAHGIPEQYTYRLTHTSLFSAIEIRQLNYESVSTGVIVYRFTNSSYMDTGTYTCTVSNGISDFRDGSFETSMSEIVWIRGPPGVTSSDTIFHAEKGHSVKLVIEFYNSLLDPSVTWYRQRNQTQEKLEGSEKYNISVAKTMVTVNFYSIPIQQPGFIATLEIRNVTEEDFSSYLVHVLNSAGKLSPLTLNLKPRENKSQEEAGPSVAAIAGGIGAAVVGISVVALVLILLKRRSYSRNKSSDELNREFQKQSASDRGTGPSYVNTAFNSDINTTQYESLQSNRCETSQYETVNDRRVDGGKPTNISETTGEIFYDQVQTYECNQGHTYSSLSSQGNGQGNSNVYENAKIVV